ncbi:ornithine cyclodeaminase family protein [Bordetella petrii]|uniref:ornithine cyclodeaminase family protein n=1 Tax=Bordetella petrii TaxID=94624 RepID=UPI000491A7DE|nr:ornithine cyclodeaminase family protein [Bordetella petrii]
MLHINDAMVDELVDAAAAQQVVRDAFAHFGRGEAAMQQRERTEAGGVKLSTLGAVIPGQQVAGAKVYTTIAGRFDFVILLFSTVDGRPLATLEANAITRLRTAASTVVAAAHLARPDCRRMMLYGAGVQGQAHARQLARAYPLERIIVSDPGASDELLRAMEDDCQVEVRRSPARAPVEESDIVVTATRARQPLFDGARLAPGTFVAAIGSSLPDTRELDDRALARAGLIAVEWLPQSRREAGELVLADPALDLGGRLVELGALVTGAHPGRRQASEITLYKAVGVGLEDVALAGLAYQRLRGDSAGA